VIRWKTHIFVGDGIGWRAFKAHLLFGRGNVHTGSTGGNNNHAEGVGTTSRIGADQGDDIFGDTGIGTPGLGTIDDPFITDVLGACANSTLDIGASARLGESQGA
jgi:hypothetical protein